MSTKQNNTNSHTFFMHLAYQQAKINLGNTKKNPSVGCVIIKHNKLISSGLTSFNGRPHAEVNAIKDSKLNVKGSNLYVTLEPCSHYGLTSPCVKKIINSKIKNVFYSVKDPDSRTFNKARTILKDNGINVFEGLLSHKLEEFYKSYFISKTSKLPFVTCKLAISKDFYTINKKKRWITNKYSRGRVHLLRSKYDCVMTSSATVIKDNPLMNCRIDGLEYTTPAIAILDKNLRVPIKSKIFKESLKRKTIIFYNKYNKKKIIKLKKMKIKTLKVSITKGKNLNLKEILIKTKKLGFSRIFLESGVTLSTSFLKDNLVNDLKIFISNEKIKQNGSGSIKSYFKYILRKNFSKTEPVNLFNEKLVSYKIKN